jgi:glycosyltransferase involved in cell wall biosynthesis
MKVLIVQPWFTAIGHPAQSTLNTAKALGERQEVAYLISDPQAGVFEPIAAGIAKYGRVLRFRVPGDSLRMGTLLAVAALARLSHHSSALERIFFLDAHLLTLAALWPLVPGRLRAVRSLGLIYLGGPEPIAAHILKRFAVTRFLSAPGRRLFLRTGELAGAWRTAFPAIPGSHIDTIASLEIPDDQDVVAPREHAARVRFGVVGQIRPGKGLEWLVPIFQRATAPGELFVAGTFTNAEHRARLAMLESHPNFDNRFLAEDQMLRAAGAQDYLLVLYDNWDPRMEAATVFLAARVGRPVIVYDEGWPGRMVREFGCGIGIARQPRPDAGFFAGLPRPGDPAYRTLLAGVERFREAHGGAPSREAFLATLLGN